MVETIQWTDAGVVMIDQTKLPREEVYVTCTRLSQVADAIRAMVIRGAPAIGVAAAMGVAHRACSRRRLDAEFDEICERSPPPGPPPSICSGPSSACAACIAELQGQAARRNPRGTGGGSPTDPSGRHRHQRGIGRNGADLIPGRQDRSDPLQRRRAGHRRIWNRAGRDPRGRRRRQEHRRLRR